MGEPKTLNQTFPDFGAQYREIMRMINKILTIQICPQMIKLVEVRLISHLIAMRSIWIYKKKTKSCKKKMKSCKTQLMIFRKKIKSHEPKLKKAMEKKCYFKNNWLIKKKLFIKQLFEEKELSKK